MSLGWAIIGTGMHPDNKIAPALKQVPDAELVAVYSRDQGRAEAFAQKHGAKAAYADLRNLMSDPRVEAVFIASPNALHAEHTRQAAQAGKHVLVEKPMATSLGDAAAMVSVCRENGVKLGVGYHLRQHPAHQEARRLVTQGVLGRITLAHGQWGLGVRGQTVPAPRTGLRQWWSEESLIGGASILMGTGVHVIDLLRFVLADEVVEVSAMTDGQTEARPLEDLATVLLRFQGGTIATVSAGRLLPDSRNDLTVYGSHGRITAAGSLWEVRQGSFEVTSESANESQTYAAAPLANYIDELADFQAAIGEDREPAASGVDGLRVVEVTQAIIESARRKRVVPVMPLAI